MGDLMPDFIKRLWERVRPWLEYFEHIDWVAGKVSLLAWAAKLGLPIMAGIIAFLIGLSDRIPKALLFLVVLGAIVLSLGIVVLWKNLTLQNNTPSDGGSPKTTKGKSQTKNKIKETHSSGVGNVILSALVTAVILLGGYKYFTEHDAMDRTALSVRPTGGVLLPGGKIPAFGMNVGWVNKGPLDINGMVYHFDFEFPHRVLSANEEDAYIDILRTFSPLEVSTATLSSGDAAWVTFYDNKGEMTDWSRVADAGTMVVYLFAIFQYNVDGAVKQTEICNYITKDWPAIHNCIGHNNKTIYR